MTQTIFGKGCVKCNLNCLVGLTSWDLWPVLGPVTRGRSRRFGFTFEGLCGTLGLHRDFGSFTFH